ncbi:Ribosomal RNA small subunit methyltransferase NEP1 [Quillaja saponaria]|uniref:Ribosomal RNA small subunit methyltransferase NEP1 n=1 Tax=Quillaja saponaria TaxID=32244 RepID=A0AAD7Q8B5_QUISA|nr:Ribosomal RNA small subunit methyltransferase NEP1 [Quillaja saponaria]
MVRPFAVKERKRKKRAEKYDREEYEEEQQMEVAKKAMIEKPNSHNEVEAAAETEEITTPELDGIPIAPSDLKTYKPKVIFVLERASLEVAKVGKTYQLLNSDDHANFLRKNNKNPADYRPDIVHQALLFILDSPLNKAGRLHAVYVRTDKGVLLEVKPHVRLPRTFKRFAGIMLQLLQQLSISAVGKREKLLRVIKNPVTQYLPVNSRKIGFSHSSKKLVNMHDYVATAGSDVDLVFVVGAMAHGKIETDYTDDYISISDYPLSAAYCITRICNALEGKWNIL